ncbi:prostacyclin receptor-like [Lethenteron reissneri]|uniref:prostacyclin receptor-like n=1 Tax=Lethenteron reissneri TaxID=7753 RepID=UPI002AB74DCC|nr:prostacyclin receptor-like [Lethenteron reissneri]
MVFERNSTHILPMHTVRTCAVMFSVGLLGNLLALAMLIRTAGRSCISCSGRGGRTGTSGTFRAACGNNNSGGGDGGGRELGAFYTLVLALTVTDLLGTCLTSPVAITAYGRNLTVPALGGAGLCTSMAACMLFFGAATQGIVCAMAVERVLCISVPFAYAGSAHRDVVLRVTLGVIFAGASLLGAAPLLGIADAVVYEPGTWCYVDMRPRGGRDGAAFPLAYASVMATLTLVTVVCNACVMVTLGRMIRRKRVLQAAGPGGAAGARERRRMHRQEEDNLTLLVSITLMSLVCTTPLTVRAIVNAVTSKSDYHRDLNALRLHAFNPILDPWMYLLGRHSFFVRLHRFVRHLCGCCPRPRRGREAPGKVSTSAASGLRRALADTGAERGLVSVRRGEQQPLEQQQQRDPHHHPQREHTEQQQQHQQQQQDPNYNQQQQQVQQQQQSHHQQKQWQLGMLGRNCQLQQQQVQLQQQQIQLQQQQLCHLQKQQLQMVPHEQQCLDKQQSHQQQQHKPGTAS